MTDSAQVANHYERDDLSVRLKEAISKAGLGDKILSASDLAPLDQFHSRGLAATKELSAALSISTNTKVLDIGSGLGGPARFLASTYGCHVHGIDLTQSFVDAAKYLADRSGLADKVTFECADALALPFADSSYDLAWTQHVAMNIADRARLYAEAFRVLKPGGHFAIYDVVAGANGAVTFPVPWSSGPETSFLVTPDAMRDLLINQGFKVTAWLDRTEDGIRWFKELVKDFAGKELPILGLNVVVGGDFIIRAANLGASMADGRAGLVEAIVQRP